MKEVMSELRSENSIGVCEKTGEDSPGKSNVRVKSVLKKTERSQH